MITGSVRLREVAVARKEEVREGRLAKRAKQGAVLAGIAAAGYAATCAHDVLSNFSPPRVPFEWKPERGRSVLLSGVSLIDVKRGQIGAATKSIRRAIELNPRSPRMIQLERILSNKAPAGSR